MDTHPRQEHGYGTVVARGPTIESVANDRLGNTTNAITTGKNNDLLLYRARTHGSRIASRKPAHSDGTVPEVQLLLGDRMTIDWKLVLLWFALIIWSIIFLYWYTVLKWPNNQTALVIAIGFLGFVWSIVGIINVVGHYENNEM